MNVVHDLFLAVLMVMVVILSGFSVVECRVAARILATTAGLSNVRNHGWVSWQCRNG